MNFWQKNQRNEERIRQKNNRRTRIIQENGMVLMPVKGKRTNQSKQKL